MQASSELLLRDDDDDRDSSMRAKWMNSRVDRLHKDFRKKKKNIW